MKKYNHALDFTVLALASAVDGDYAKAGKLLLKASRTHDVQRAVQVLEASNAQAFAAEQARVQAAAKSAKSTTTAKTKVKAFDIGDDAAIDGLIGDGAPEEVEEVEEVGAAEEGEDDEDFSVAFASVLRAMTTK